MKKLLLVIQGMILCTSLFSQTLDGEYLNPLGDDGDPYKWIRFGNPTEYWSGFMWNNTNVAYGNGNDFTIFTYDNRDIVFRPGNGNIVLFPDATSGNVGIGTNAPKHRLSLYSNTDFNYNSPNSNTAGILLGGGSIGINNYTSPLLFRMASVNYGGGSAISGVQCAADNDQLGLAFFTHPSGTGSEPLVEQVRINYNGNVGIGTKDPKAKLSVNGTIISTEIKVLANISQYPDFVFSKSYNLRSLNEVEQFIEQNNHLPDIPKADEVKEGIALGMMNTKLLQKIEELTLYTIEQQKEIEDLKEIIKRSGLK